MGDRFIWRRVNEITGTFLLVAVAVVIAAVVWTGKSQRWFKSKVPLRIILPEEGAAGIRQGSEVYFLGTRVGSVSDVLVDSAGRMEAQTQIRKDFFRFVRADSSALVKRKFGVAGDSFFEITRGEGKPLPEQNASIVCNEQYQSALESAIEELRQEALRVMGQTSTGLATWTQLGTDLGETRARLEQLAVRLERMAANAEAGEGTIGRLIARSTLADEGERVLGQANEALSELRGVVTNLAAVARSTREGTVRLPEIVDLIAAEAQDLPGLVEQTQSSMRELERLVKAMQQHWLLRKYVERLEGVQTAPRGDGDEKKASPSKGGTRERRGSIR